MRSVLCLRNRQHLRDVDTRLLRRLTLHLLKAEFAASPFELCIHLVDAPEMAQVNERFLQHTGSTDVITFDYSAPASRTMDGNTGAAVAGEIFISLPDTVAQATQYRTTWQEELARYVIHGLLHLRGYDDLEPRHRRVMKREENRLLQKLARTFCLKELARPQTRPGPRRPRASAP